MKASGFLLWLLSGLTVFSQVIQPPAFKQIVGSGVSKVRVVQQSADGAEVTLAMEFTYDGLAGPTALLFPVIEKKDKRGVSSWFGADPVTIGVGKGPISMKVKYFNDEPDVPAEIVTDRIRILMINSGKTAIVGGSTALLTIRWGNPDAKPAVSAAEVQKMRQAEEQARLESEARVREEARLKAEREAKAFAEEKARLEKQAQELAAARRVAEEKAKAEAKLRAEAQIKAEAEAKRLADLEKQEREKIQARLAKEAKEREESQLRAEQEARARAEAQAKAEAETKRIAEASRLAEERLKVETEAKSRADEQSKAAALAARKPVATAQEESAPAPPTQLKTRITNVDVVNRSLDRSQMTIGVEYDYKDNFPRPLLGVDVLRANEPQAVAYFKSTPAEIGRSRRNFVLLPVKFQPPAAQSAAFAAFSTDKVLIYMSDGAQKLNLFPTTMMLLWRAPGTSLAGAAGSAQATLQWDDFKQNNLFSGYVTVKYFLPDNGGKIRVRIFQANRPESAEWFESEEVEVKGGAGLQLVKMGVRPDATSPSDLIDADTVEIQMMDRRGEVVSRLTRQLVSRWAKPK